MKKKNQYSTSTIINSREIVPWLASSGSLAYSPEIPPARDYFFQYSWVIPSVFNNKINKRQHRWFGNCFRDHHEVDILFEFWNNNRKRLVNQIFKTNGSITPHLQFPIGIYQHKEYAIFIQHGSYQIIKKKKQPLLKDGFVLLYRGIGEDKIYRHHILEDLTVYNKIMEIHSSTMTDSVKSFNTVHCNVKRVQSSALNDDTFILNEYADKIGGKNLQKIYSILNSGYSIDSNCGGRKFGPNHVALKTPVSNIRITTFFCGEGEVKVIDPNNLEVVRTIGCKIQDSYI